MPKHAGAKHKGPMPPKGKHMMPNGEKMHGEHHPVPKPKKRGK